MNSFLVSWRYAILFLLVFATLAIALRAAPVAQDPAYHAFVDSREMLGLRNCLNVLSNIPFLLVGAMGLRFFARRRTEYEAAPWIAFFAGVMMVAAGSSWYHLRPGNDSLVWDRLPLPRVTAFC
jgi:hypothetical protein